ncbi:MAG: hypothetical protein C4549_02600 [Deltaproteobacteria bacterium]|jgi:hypothetical protein|nr:MAG: hypothetical protein C4549_02600 [Deltaproteobacteria bacterium]
MGIWIVIIISGICAVFSFYMAFLAFRNGDSSAFLFSSFGLFFGIPFIISLIKAFSKRGALKPEPQPVRFVPHWFMMTAIIVTGLVVIVSILISIIRAVR